MTFYNLNVSRKIHAVGVPPKTMEAGYNTSENDVSGK